MMRAPPLVSMVTPVYNGEKYLRECIESVLAQTYPHWEYIIVDNCSTDRTPGIAASYAAQDQRIRIVRNAGFLPLIANWNHALRQIGPDAKSCKVIHADDRLYTECVARMVDMAERYPTIGIVGAYRLDEDVVNLNGLERRSGLIPGRELCRWRLMGGADVFGSPTSILLRADLVRRRERFYDEELLHADTDVCFDLLRETDFGIVPEVLTYTRRHNESVTSFARRVNTHKAESLVILKRYGRCYLTETEYTRLFEQRLDAYYRFLARNIVRIAIRDDRHQLHEFVDFHRRSLARVGCRLSAYRLARGLAEALRRSGKPRGNGKGKRAQQEIG